MPLDILGTVWIFVKQMMIDVENVLNLLEVDETIPEPAHPIPFKLGAGTIEFKNVSFTYDTHLEASE